MPATGDKIQFEVVHADVKGKKRERASKVRVVGGEPAGGTAMVTVGGESYGPDDIVS